MRVFAKNQGQGFLLPFGPSGNNTTSLSAAVSRRRKVGYAGKWVTGVAAAERACGVRNGESEATNIM